MSDKAQILHLQKAFHDFIERQGFSLNTSEKQRMEWYVGNLIESAYTAGIQIKDSVLSTQKIMPAPTPKEKEDIISIQLSHSSKNTENKDIQFLNPREMSLENDIKKFEIIVQTLCSLYRDNLHENELEELTDCIEEEGMELCLHLYNPARGSRELDDIYYYTDKDGNYVAEIDYDVQGGYFGSILEWPGTIDALVSFIQEHTKKVGEIIVDKLMEQETVKTEEYEDR